MKKTIKASVGGYAFTFDTDAYDLLNTYLDDLKAYYRSEIGGQEIIDDIEARMSELLLLQVAKTNNIITSEEAKQLIQIMGNPKDFGDSDEDSKSTSKEDSPNLKKRLYRDKDHSIIGGVCSGLGQYFRIDTTVLRITYIASIILTHFISHRLSGALFLTYFILWIVTPKAKTITQKIAMTGRNVSIDLVGRGNEHSTQLRGKGIGNVLSKVSKTVLVIISLIILIPIVLLVILKQIFPLFTNYDTIRDILETTGFYSNSISASLFLMWLIPIFMILYFVVRLIIKIKGRDFIVLGLSFVAWIGVCFYFVAQVISFGRDYKEEATYTEKFTIDTQSDTVQIHLDNKLLQAEILVSNENIYQIDGNPKSWFLTPEIKVEKSTTYKNIEIEIHKRAFARSQYEADNKAKNSKIDISKDSLQLIIKPQLYNKENVWDREIFSVTIHCPENKEIIIDKMLHKERNNRRHDYHSRKKYKDGDDD